MKPSANHPSIILASVLMGLSGIAALMYETAWTRTFEALLGHTAGTTATVIAGFLGGLAVGALSVARLQDRIRRPLRVYGVLELGAACWVLALPSLVRTVDSVGARVMGGGWAAPGPGDGVRWAATFLLILVPAAGLGATFPLVVRAVAGAGREEGRSAGALYAANTAGAVVGAVLAGFLTVRYLGVRGTLLTGVFAGGVAGTLGVVLGGRPFGGDKEIWSGKASSAAVPLKWIAAVLALSGLASLADEVLWLRLFVFPLGSNLLSFAIVVGTLLAAIAAGSWIGKRLAGTPEDSWRRLGWAELALGAGALATLAGFFELRFLLTEGGRLLGGVSILSSFTGRAVLASVLMGLPGLAMGALLPLAIGAAGDLAPDGRASAVAYAALSAGNVGGALLAGYLLLPAVGLTSAALGMAGLSLSLGLVVLATAGRRLIAAVITATAAVGVGLLAASAGPGVVSRVAMVRDPHTRLLDAIEGVQGTVTVSEVPGLPVLAANRQSNRIGPYGFSYRLVAADAVQVAGTAPDLRTTQKLQAHVPLLLHGAPRKVLQIGYGSGETATEALLHQHPLVTVVELNPDIVSMTRRWFPEFTGQVLSMRYTDAKLAVRTALEKWDVILNDSTYPGMAGSSQLYSLEHFQACRARLEPGGLVSTWLPVDLPPRTFRTVLATFARVFPRCSFWLAPVCLNKHGLLVGAVGGSGPMVPPPESAWPQAVRGSLKLLGIRRADNLAACRVLDREGIQRLATGVPLNTDDYPILEFPTRGVRISGMDLWAETLTLVLQRCNPPSHAAAMRAMLQGQRALLEGDPKRALGLYQEAGAEWPDSPWPENLIEGIQVQRAQAEFGLAELALRRGDKEPAVDHLRRAASFAPDSAAVQGALGRILLRLGRWREAAGALELAVRHAADPAPFELALADAMRFAGDPAKAEQLYRRSLVRDGPSFELLAALSDAVDRQGRLRQAVELMRRAVRLAPDRQDGVMVLAGLLLRSGDVEAARTLLKRALERHPGWTEVSLALARLHFSDGG